MNRRTIITFIGLLALTGSITLPARGVDSHILWRFELPGQYVPVDPVRADDGTIYVLDLLGDLHAVNPDGTEQWTVAGVGNQGLDVGPDGTIYAGTRATSSRCIPTAPRRGTIRYRIRRS